MHEPAVAEPASCRRCGGNLKFLIQLRRSESAAGYRVYKCDSCDRIECHPAAQPERS